MAQETDGEGAIFRLEDLIERKRGMSFPYLEFLRAESLSAGIYSLAAGSKDLQGPHDEDELYYVISGRARVRIEEDEDPVGPGSIIYVPASAPHRFVEIEEDVTLLVFFASPRPG